MCIMNCVYYIYSIYYYNLFIVHVSLAHNLNFVFSFVLLEFHVPRLGASLVGTSHALKVHMPRTPGAKVTWGLWGGLHKDKEADIKEEGEES